jgi:hypothetical protein
MQYDKSIFQKAFSKKVSFHQDDIIPYHMNDAKLKFKIIDYLLSIQDWKDISYTEIYNKFGVDKELLFYSLGWRSLYQITPALISLSYDTYENGDMLILCAESILANYNYRSGDNSIQYADWMLMFDARQRNEIIKFIDSMALDPLGFFPDGFGMGSEHWRL